MGGFPRDTFGTVPGWFELRWKGSHSRFAHHNVDRLAQSRPN